MLTSAAFRAFRGRGAAAHTLRCTLLRHSGRLGPLPAAASFSTAKIPTENAGTSSDESSSSSSASSSRFSAQRGSGGEGTMYDVFVVGGGITGSALAYELAAFTNLKRLGLAERRSDFSQVASGPNNNSQTIHCGDIETNYTVQKAATVKRQADMLRNFATKLPEGVRDKCVYRMQKMVIGVGEDECEQLEKRYPVFKELFPRMQLIEKRKIAELEPLVAKGRKRQELLNALYIPGEYSAVNYYTMTHAFIAKAKEEAAAASKQLDIATGMEVRDVFAEPDDTYTLLTNKGKVKSRFVVFAGCGYSLLFAQRLGYGLKYGCLPVAGSFYFAKKPVLTGKVYTIQNPKLPFAAVHGDPDVHAVGKTRFGPTALPLPLLERYNWGSFKDWFSVAGIDLNYLRVMAGLMADPTTINYTLRNFLFETPYLGDRLFLKDASKVIPTLRLGDLEYADGYGGVRPQLVDKKTRKLQLGEGKILGKNAIFNITPSPGGTTCIGNGEIDLRNIANSIGAEIDERKLRRTLYEGEYPVDH